ncbi:MAG: NAD(P)-dependent oxidoreductase [Chloroflexota bacterium]
MAQKALTYAKFKALEGAIMPEKKLGFIGLGEMGRPMVKNLLKAGYQVTVWNRSQPGIDECVSYGATAGKSARDVAEKSDVVMVMVFAPEDVRRVVLGRNGVIEGVHPGLKVIDMTTNSPGVSKEIAGKLRQKGILMLDAPVSGYATGAKSGTLTIMVGGAEAVFRECLPIFQAMGKNIVYMGGQGTGHATKLCNQVLCGLGIMATSEAFLVARAWGLDPAKMFSVLRTGVAGSTLFDRYGHQILEGETRAGGSARRADAMKKDLALIVKEARSVGVSLPGSKLTEALYRKTGTEETRERGALGLMRLLEKSKSEQQRQG